MGLYKTVTHVIFDMDGLVIESESIYNRIITEIAEKYGKVYTLPIKLKILGTPEQDTGKIAIKEMDLPITLDEFMEQYKKKCQEGLKHPTLMPGAERLIRHLSKNKIPIAVATSSSQSAMELKGADHKELFSLFHHMVCGSTDTEVKNGKPAPDIFLVCASRFPDKPSAENCLVLEDAPNGVTGALAAGMQAVIVPDPDIGEEKRKPATLCLDSLLDFKPELFGLPPFDEEIMSNSI